MTCQAGIGLDKYPNQVLKSEESMPRSFSSKSPIGLGFFSMIFWLGLSANFTLLPQPDQWWALAIEMLVPKSHSECTRIQFRQSASIQNPIRKGLTSNKESVKPQRKPLQLHQDAKTQGLMQSPMSPKVNSLMAR